jgi:hypothetical protein
MLDPLIVDNLAYREKEIFNLIVRGLSIDEIAKSLFVGYQTANNIAHTLRKRFQKTTHKLIAGYYQTRLCELQLGRDAAIAIAQGGPKEIDGYIVFWINGIECSWGIDTNPVLLQVTETDQEFDNFIDLLDAITEILPH